MPRSTREWAIRKFDMAEGNINWAIQHLAEVAETYQIEHPEISAACLLFIESLQVSQKAIVQTRMSI